MSLEFIRKLVQGRQINQELEGNQEFDESQELDGTRRLKAWDKTRKNVDYLKEHFYNFLKGMETKTMEVVQELSPKIDARVLEGTVDSLGEDDSLEEFIEAIPGFYRSEEVTGFQEHLSSSFIIKFSQTLYGFLDRTLTSNSIPELGKISRLIICLDAAYAVQASRSLLLRILRHIFNDRWKELSQSVEMGHSLTSWEKSGDGDSALLARIIVSRIIASAQKRDDRWSTLVKDHLDISDDDPDGFLRDRNSVLLANLMYITRQTNPSHLEEQRRVQKLISDFDVQDTHPKLQHKFCSLWNEMVHRLHPKSRQTSLLLANIRQIYDKLHPEIPEISAAQVSSSTSTAMANRIVFYGTSYPLCNIPSHHPGSINEVTEGEAAPTTSPSNHLPSTGLDSDAPSVPVLNPGHTSPHSGEESLHDHATDAQQLERSTPLPSSSQLELAPEMLDRDRIHAALSDVNTGSAT